MGRGKHWTKERITQQIKLKEQEIKQLKPKIKQNESKER
jgi:hypothetical protein